jgi:hypothetical protein
LVLLKVYGQQSARFDLGCRCLGRGDVGFAGIRNALQPTQVTLSRGKVASFESEFSEQKQGFFGVRTQKIAIDQRTGRSRLAGGLGLFEEFLGGWIGTITNGCLFTGRQCQKCLLDDSNERPVLLAIQAHQLTARIFHQAAELIRSGDRLLGFKKFQGFAQLFARARPGA